jgi:antitoxin ParD1/3/4
MDVVLPADQLKWIEDQVTSGRFASISEALVVAVADLMTIQNDDLAWAKPYVEEARASIARGDVSSGEGFLGRLDARLETLRSR